MPLKAPASLLTQLFMVSACNLTHNVCVKLAEDTQAFKNTNLARSLAVSQFADHVTLTGHLLA